MAEDSALTRFANSEIHQNVAETNVVDQPAGRGRQAGRRGLHRAGPTTRASAGWPTNAAAIARVVEELEDLGGASCAEASGPWHRLRLRWLRPDGSPGHLIDVVHASDAYAPDADGPAPRAGRT